MKKTLGFAAFSAGAMLAGSGVASAQEAPPPPDRPPVHPYTVRVGESLSTISLAELGASDRWGEIFSLNRNNLSSPEVIKAGQVLQVPTPPPAVPEVPAPAPEAPAPTDRPPARPYAVVAGESLTTISQAELGTADRWVEIFVLNRDTVASPEVIAVGQVLQIPLAPVAVPPEVLAGLVPRSAPAPAPSLRSLTVASAAAATAPAVGSAATVRASGGGGNLASIRACESGGNYGAVSADGLYRGAYQFDRPTWQSVGGSGDPAAASPAEQDARASQLASERGSSPWPNCG